MEMRVVIVEDELAASDNLAYLLHSIDDSIEILKVLDSVAASVDYFTKPNNAELVFMDIHLADGISFEIFDRAKISIPVIFTTAYDQYALKAFKVNSIDYLLKPIDQEELGEALEQFTLQSKDRSISEHQMNGLLDLIKVGKPTYKSTFLVSQRDQLVPLKIENIAYFRIESGIVWATTLNNMSYSIDSKLEEIEEEIDPSLFYRANRQFIIKKDVIAKIKYYFNGKLIVSVNPDCAERIVISKAKATDFKNWMAS